MRIGVTTFTTDLAMSPIELAREAELRAAVEARGRDFGALHIVPMGVLPDPAKLDHYASIGVTEAVLRLPSAERDTVLPVLDRYAREYV